MTLHDNAPLSESLDITLLTVGLREFATHWLVDGAGRSLPLLASVVVVDKPLEVGQLLVEVLEALASLLVGHIHLVLLVLPNDVALDFLQLKKAG